MLDAEVVPRASRKPAMLDHLLQGVQNLDPHQVHDQHHQQTQTWLGKQNGSLQNSERRPHKAAELAGLIQTHSSVYSTNLLTICDHQSSDIF